MQFCPPCPGKTRITMEHHLYWNIPCHCMGVPVQICNYVTVTCTSSRTSPCKAPQRPLSNTNRLEKMQWASDASSMWEQQLWCGSLTIQPAGLPSGVLCGGTLQRGTTEKENHKGGWDTESQDGLGVSEVLIFEMQHAFAHKGEDRSYDSGKFTISEN